MRKKSYTDNETPMREIFRIDDEELVNLIKDIFITLDQPWSDIQAFEIADLIEAYQAKKGIS